ncbi:unnamed protein product [Closterium sp. NIES-64]|nr:unnamed protein product [Closterium sp. NIES-64]
MRGVPGLGISGVCSRPVCGQAVPSCFFPASSSGFPPDAPGWQFYHPTSRRVLSSQDVTFDESVPPQVVPPPPSGSCPFSLGGAVSGGTEPGGAEPGGAEPGGAGAWRCCAWGVLRLAGSRSLPQELREWFARRWRRAAGAGGSSAAEGAAANATLAVLVLWVLELLGLRVLLELVLLRTLALSLRLVVRLTVLLVLLLEVLELLGGSAGVLLEWVLRPELLVLFLLFSGVAARSRPYFVPLLEQALLSVVSLRLVLRRLFVLSALVVAGRVSVLLLSLARTGCPLRPSTAPLRAPLPSPPASSLPALADPESDALRAASPTVTRLLATAVTDPSFESSAASALVTELVDFAARCRLDYAARLVA